MAQKQVHITDGEVMYAGRGGEQGPIPLLEQEKYVLRKLQDAGFPVVGSTVLCSLREGELRIRRTMTGRLYTWVYG